MKIKKFNNGMKILGMSLIFLAVPGSALMLPFLLKKIKSKKVQKEVEERDYWEIGI
jgi:hypothetical protein